MAYFVFLKNSDGVEGSLCHIAETKFDLDNLNINKSEYKIIEESQSNFDLVKYGNKNIIKYNNNNISFSDTSIIFDKKEYLDNYINNFKIQIKHFLNNNLKHPLYEIWNNFYIQLNNLNLNNITYPLNKSLEQYFKDQNQISLHPLQLP